MDRAAADYFGYSVSISGDYAVIGAIGDDDKRSVSGSAITFAMFDETKRDATCVLELSTFITNFRLQYV